MPKGHYKRKTKKVLKVVDTVCVVEPELETCSENNMIQINFPTQEEKAAAIADQQATNVTEEANAKIVYDKRVKRGTDMLNDLNNATVGAVVPPVVTATIVAGVRAQAEFTKQDMAGIVNSLVSDPSVAAQVNAQQNAKVAAQTDAVANAINSGSVLTNRLV